MIHLFILTVAAVILFQVVRSKSQGTRQTSSMFGAVTGFFGALM